MVSIKTALAASFMAFSTANAHMIMATPIPYGSPNNSPLVADGSDFPCKTTSNSGAKMNQMAIGAPQPLKFTGSAVHGGGSCQISLTKDMPATKSSTWQVIHSIEGGCPAKGVAGNLPGAEDPTSTGSSTYSFTIPDGIAPGEYTLAWTWFNKIGNREMYMNCASVQVTGGSKKRDTQEHPRDFYANETFAIPELGERDTSFPDMFVANIPTTNCETVDSADLQFPNPGSSLEKDGSSALTPPTGGKCGAGPAAAGGAGGASSSGSGAGAGAAASPAASAPTGASGASGSGTGAGSSAPAASPAAASSSPAASAAAPSGQASAVVSAAAGGAGAASPSSPAAPYANSSGSAASAAPAAPSTPASPSGSTPGSAPATGGASTGTCTTAGASICSPDGKQIGTCTSGMTVTWIPVAAGTKCSGGLMVMAGSKMIKPRSAKFLRWAF